MDDIEVAPRKHGAASLAVACRHIVNYMERMSARHPGFHTAPSDTRRFPDAWCTACDKRLAAAGGEWTPGVLTRAGFQKLCPCCYEFASAAGPAGAQVQMVRWR
jgi:hypothetical protein